VKCFNTIYTRLFLPFSAILLVASLSAWLLTTSLFTATLERRLEAQLQHATAILAEGNIPYTKALLERLGKLVKADILLLKSPDEVGVTTIDNTRKTNQLLTAAALSDKIVMRSATIEINKIPYKLVIAPITTRSESSNYVAVIAASSLEDVYKTSKEVMALLAIAVMSGIALFAIIGHGAVKSITSRIRQLVEMTKLISAGDRSVRVSTSGTIELVELARNLNLMAEQLGSYEIEVAENSRKAAMGQMAARIAHANRIVK
jgi:HAMP domain-containing protein